MGLAAPTSRNVSEIEGSAATPMHLLQDVHVRDLSLGPVDRCPAPEGFVERPTQVALRTPDDLRSRVAGVAAAALAETATNAVATWAMVYHAGRDSLGRLVSRSLDVYVEPTVLRDVLAEVVAVMATDDEHGRRADDRAGGGERMPCRAAAEGRRLVAGRQRSL